MARGSANKSAVKGADYRVHVVVGVLLLVGLVAATVTLSAHLPAHSQACRLMPGFCAKKSEQSSRGGFDELGRMGPGAAKFGLRELLSHSY
jgi:hypothetical protein